MNETDTKPKIVTIFGTRPEAIKLAPVVRHLDLHDDVESVTIATGQHRELSRDMIDYFRMRIDIDLDVMEPGLSLNALLAKTIRAIDPHLERLAPKMVLVQGDTLSALAGAICAFQRGIEVGHIEAGLRTPTAKNPFPEEMNRRLVTRMTDWHFAATRSNVRNLRREGVLKTNIFRVGNPVLDSLALMGDVGAHSHADELLNRVGGRPYILMTMHRRENLGERMRDYFRAIVGHLHNNPDWCVVFPVHPNPSVVRLAAEMFASEPNAVLCEPLGYGDFQHLLRGASLILSDSGGVQEEAPWYRRPLIVLRESTERPEVVECGFARLAVDGSELAQQLAEVVKPADIEDKPNPFGDGRSGPRIARIVTRIACRQTLPTPEARR